MEEQRDRKDIDYSLVQLAISPGGLARTEEKSTTWGTRDEFNRKKLSQEEAITGRLDEGTQLHAHNVYKQVAEEQRWQSNGNRPVHVKWIHISKRHGVKHAYRSRIVATEIGVAMWL